MTGSWTIAVSNGMSQKVASAVGSLAEKLIGAEYEPILYLGSQVVNGTNHAVLAKQILTTGRDTTNVVLLIFNEKPGDMEATLVSIDRLVEGGLPFGGVQINPTTDIPVNAKEVWDAAFSDRIGLSATPVAYLGSQVATGMNYIFIATTAPVVPDAETSLQLVSVNDMTKNVTFADIFGNKADMLVGYAFTWLGKK